MHITRLVVQLYTFWKIIEIIGGFLLFFLHLFLTIKCVCACACVCVCACVRERERERERESEREITEVLLSGHSVTFFAAVCWFGFGAGSESLETVVTTHPLPPVRPRPVHFQQQGTKIVNNPHAMPLVTTRNLWVFNICWLIETYQEGNIFLCLRWNTSSRTRWMWHSRRTRSDTCGTGSVHPSSSYPRARPCSHSTRTRQRRCN